VIAIFIGGLGTGGLWLGRRADKHPRPLTMYAHLELGVALLAAVSPALLVAIRALYVVLGGSFVLGGPGAAAVRLVLATLVLAGPTFLMGGTLPAAARAVEREGDAGRRDVALLYGVNTLGAVSGALVATFIGLEVFGTRLTLIMACLVNALVGVVARGVSRSLEAAPPISEASTEDAAPIVTTHVAPAVERFALIAALVVGFAFFLMEIVWYRMLGPLLGGTVFTFGLVLAMALFGIGVGGAISGLKSERREATLTGFAGTCLGEALAIIVPFALGDKLALLALRLQPLSGFGLLGYFGAWAVVAAIVILPAAIFAGIQFPLLIALVGRGRERVGEQIGRVYAWNTVGAIAGAVAGGFGLLPVLSATGCWRLVALGLLVLGVAAVGLSLAQGASRRALIVPAACALIATPLLRAQGPTAVWRHGSIGAGRADIQSVHAPNATLDFETTLRREHIWAHDGVESSVALNARNGLSFIVNGKNDGNARSDAATQVMCGLLPAMLHPAPKRGLVIGLGTGSTGGWLAAVPEIEHVDVVELEPLVREMARRSAPVNHDALANPKLQVRIGDGREAVLTLPQRYDVIASEPSNPYRAGIASLYTREFYESAARRLTDDGMFAQWLQAYEVDAQTIRTVIATIAAAFPNVEIWELKSSDILLIASKKPIAYDVDRLRERIAQEPFKSALRSAWRTLELEGVFAHYVARPSLARSIRELEGDTLNTDDTTLIEFGFARSLGRSSELAVDLRRLARTRGEHLPEMKGSLDLARLDDERAAWLTIGNDDPLVPPEASKGHHTRQRARKASFDRAFPAAMREWQQQESPPTSYLDITLMAEAAAETGSDETPAIVEKLRAISPLEATCVEGRYLWTKRKPDEAAAKILEFLNGLRTDPWPDVAIGARCLQLAGSAALRSPELTTKVFDIVAAGPFAVYLLESQRQALLRDLSATPTPERCTAAYAAIEPNPEWSRTALEGRLRCYRTTGHPLAAKAESDLRDFLRNEPIPIDQDLMPPPNVPSR
jgi:spermidine synthase